MDGQTQTGSLSEQELAERVRKAEQRIDCMENTLAAVASEIDGLSLSCRCSKCESAMLLITDGVLHCPNCGDRHSL